MGKRPKSGFLTQYPLVKKLQSKGLSYGEISSILHIGNHTAQMMYKSQSFEEFKELRADYYEREKQRKIRKKEKEELEKSLKPAAGLPIFKVAEAVSEAEKQNEIIMSRLELLGTPYEISLIAKVAEKMGVQNKFTTTVN